MWCNFAVKLLSLCRLQKKLSSAAVKCPIRILLKKNHSIAWLAARHNHGGIFNQISECWHQTHVTTFWGKESELHSFCPWMLKTILYATVCVMNDSKIYIHIPPNIHTYTHPISCLTDYTEILAGFIRNQNRITDHIS